MNNKALAIAASGTAAGHERSRVAPSPPSRVTIGYRSPSQAFVSLTRNPELAANPPLRFEPTTKADGDIVL